MSWRARVRLCLAKAPLVFAGFLLSAEPGAAREPGDDEGKAEHFEAAAPLASPLAPATAPAAAETDVQHYRLEIELLPEFTGPDLTAVQVVGTSTIDFVPAIDGLTTFTVDLDAALVVDAVTGDVASFARVGDTIEVTLDATYDTGEPVQLAVGYHGYPPSSDVFRFWVWDGDVVLATLSEPYFARTWWPCKDQLDDKATMEMQVVVPDPLVALSNGIEVGTQALAGSRTKYLWHESQPMIAYLASLAVTTYRRYDQTWSYDPGTGPETMDVPCYVYASRWNDLLDEPVASVKAGCDEMPEMLDTFSALYGLYPFVGEKYGVVEVGGSDGFGASMEHQTLSHMRRVNNFTDIMAHELAHQWWGDDVTCETWHDIWLNEGFASYGESLFREFRPAGSIDDYWERMEQRRPSVPDNAVYRTSIDTVGAIFSTNDVYRKGSWVLHMLRGVLGDTAFLQLLADYRAAHRQDSATTAEFAAAASASFGHDLGWFTDQWVLAEGSPDYTWRWEPASLPAGPILKLRVTQGQGAQGYGLITMPLDLRVTTPSGTETHRVWNDGWDETYVLVLSEPATDVTLDEDGAPERNWVLTSTKAELAGAVAGPPVLLAASVSPGTGEGGGTVVTLDFSEDVGGFQPGDATLLGDDSGNHAATSATWDAAALRATIQFPPLVPDAYTLTLLAAGVLANGQPLDGETGTADWWDSTVLPSGDGVPGGDAVVAFDVAVAACSDGVDNDGDGGIDWNGGPGGEPADGFCTSPSRLREKPLRGCGLGAELSLVVALLLGARSLRRPRGRSS